MKNISPNKYKEIILVELKNDITKKETNYIESLLIPIFIVIVSTVLSVVLSKIIKTKKEREEINKLKLDIKNIEKRKDDEEKKLKVEVEKLNQEVINFKKSYQPFVFDNLNRIGNELLPRKVRLLENLIRIKNEFFDFENSYYNGQRSIDDLSEYYARISRNINKSILSDFNKHVSQEVYYFNSEIISKINELSSELNTLYEYDLHQTSLLNQNMHIDAESCIKTISELFKNSIHLIREDLQIDNQYIQKFLQRYNTIE